MTIAALKPSPPPNTSSRLLALPRELRDIIYDYALIKRDSGGVIHINIISKPAALTQVNRQIHSETLGVWWLKTDSASGSLPVMLGSSQASSV